MSVNLLTAMEEGLTVRVRFRKLVNCVLAVRVTVLA